MDIFAKFSAFIKNSRPEANEGGSLGGQGTPAFPVLWFSEQLCGKGLPDRFSCMRPLRVSWIKILFKCNVKDFNIWKRASVQSEFQFWMVCEYPWHRIFSVQQPLTTFEWRINISTARNKSQAEFVWCPNGWISVHLLLLFHLSRTEGSHSEFWVKLSLCYNHERIKPFCVEGKQEISHEGSISGKELTAGPLSSSVQINFILRVLRGKTKLRESRFLSAAFQRERWKIFVKSWEIKGDLMGFAALCCCIPHPALFQCHPGCSGFGQGCLLSMWH